METTKFEIGKEYKVNFKNGNEAGILVFTSFEKFRDMSFGVNKCFEGYAKLNGRTVKVVIVGQELATAWLVNGNKRYAQVWA